MHLFLFPFLKMTARQYCQFHSDTTVSFQVLSLLIFVTLSETVRSFEPIILHIFIYLTSPPVCNPSHMATATPCPEQMPSLPSPCSSDALLQAPHSLPFPRWCGCLPYWAPFNHFGTEWFGKGREEKEEGKEKAVTQFMEMV